VKIEEVEKEKHTIRQSHRDGKHTHTEREREKELLLLLLLLL
jgi:hypothetical protein